MRVSWLVLLATLVAQSAHASEGFPRVVADDLGLPLDPECSLCHQGDVRNYDSVRTPFGLAIRARGAGAGDRDALVRAIALLASEGIDGDRDGIGDVAELQAGTDPNVAEGHASIPVRYGCSLARGSTQSSGRDLAIWLALGVAGVLIARRATSGSHGP